MLLAIDSGNTNVVFAVFDPEGIMLGQWRISADLSRTADEYGIWLTQLMALNGITPDRINHAIMASVVPESNFELKSLCWKYFGCEAKMIRDKDMDIGIRVEIEHPGDVGADRLVNAVAAQEEHDGPLIIVDFGTATTFDVIDGKGAYKGGVIAPGIHLSLEALYNAAAQLPRVAFENPEKVIGQGTVSAMKSGIFWGYVSMIEGLVRRIKDEYGEEMTVVATGGLASLFAAATDTIDHADPDITMKGLYHIHQRNAS